MIDGEARLLIKGVRDDMKPISRQLAEWCAGVKYADLPSEIRTQIPLRILDTVGLAIAGSTTAAVKAARGFVEGLSGAPQSTLIGSARRVPSAFAALVHGIAAHCYDFDDTLTDPVVHPGSVVIPTVLALAEASSPSNEDFCASIAVGYEVAARIGAVAGRRFHARNMHATGIVGPIAAAAASGRLLRLDGARISWAIGLATSMSSGTRAYAIDGGWSKWLHVGWAAHGGIMATELASRGFRGPEHVLDGGHDLYAVMLHGDQVDRSKLLADLGHVWTGASSQFKYYPCAHVIHPFIDAVLEIVRHHDLKAIDIQEIECAIAPWAAAIVCEPRESKLRVDTELEAIGSLPYQLSVAVLDRSVTLDALAESTRKRRDLGDFARRVIHRKDVSLGSSFGGQVSVKTRYGKSYIQKAMLAGTDLTKVRTKFVDLVGPIVTREAADRAARVLLNSTPSNWRHASELFASIKGPL